MTTKLESPKLEPIRAWWTRRTAGIRKAIFWSSILSLAGAVVLYLLVPKDVTSKIQVFNGAYVIPVFGALWIAAFVFLFLVPSREVAFRSQETLDRTEARVQTSLDVVDAFLVKEAKPALEEIRQALRTVQTQYFDMVKETVRACQHAATHAIETTDRAEHRLVQIEQKMTPIVEASGRVLGQIEQSLRAGLLLKLEAAVETANLLGLPSRPKSPEPDLGRSIKSLEKKPGVPAATRPAPAPEPPKPSASLVSRLQLGAAAPASKGRVPQPKAVPRVLARS